MKLSRYTLKNITSPNVLVPDESVFELPEKVLQFGTGVFLRGLPDYLIDKANRRGLFNGRIVVVKSTTQGDSATFHRQDGLYTLCVRDVHGEVPVEENIINSSISRVLDASAEWSAILDCAHNQYMQVIISNTTEVGIQLVNDDIRRHPPVSFPGKLLAFLYERFQAFGGSEHSGMVIVPTELIPDNGKRLEAIVLELAHLNGLEENFIEWLECCNHFCGSLVDRIVPGKPDVEVKSALENELGYNDDLMVVTEAYRLWAIEGDDQIKKILSFAQADEGVVIEPNIDLYRELKLRLLNGTHTLSCGLAFLAGCVTVKEAMSNVAVAQFMTHLMQDELLPAIPYDVELGKANDFASKVLQRFQNPFLKHQWLNITLHYSSKMKTRCIPVLHKHYQESEVVPELFTLGFAAYLYFMKATIKDETGFYGQLNGKPYLIQDDLAERFYKRWQTLSPEKLVREVLRDSAFWGADLHTLPGFEPAVTDKLNQMIYSGIGQAIESALSGRTAFVQA